MPSPSLMSALVAVGLALSPATAPAAVPGGLGRVLAVETTTVADLVVFDAGFAAGLRQGMICRITRAGSEIAQMVVVDLRDGVSTGLLATVTPGQSVHPGDTVHIKIRNS